MQIFIRAKQSLIVVFFIAMLFGYHNVVAETSETPKVQTNIWSGVYHGFLPCEDCKGIKTSLALNKNDTYILMFQYTGKSDREITEKGKFTWDDASNTITLTPRKGGANRYYFVGDNMLIQLDDKGFRITGDDADRYILRRNEMAQTAPSSHSGH